MCESHFTSVHRRISHYLPQLYSMNILIGTCSANATGVIRVKVVEYVINTIDRFVFNIRKCEHVSDFIRFRNLMLFHRTIKSGTFIEGFYILTF